MRQAFSCLLAGLLLLSALDGADRKPLKVYVSVDMEGIWGVVHAEQTSSGSADYAAARRWMAEDAEAIVAGLLAGGATEIVVNDSHGSMRNILPGTVGSTQSAPASLISGTPKPLSMMEGIDRSFSACLFIGYHAKAGTANAILDHTISSSVVYSIRVNGVEMPELGLNAAIAGHFGVPLVMVSGDVAVCRQTRELLGEGVVTVAVKEAMGRSAARLLPMAEAREVLKAGAREALLRIGQCKPFLLKKPFQFEVAFMNSGQAEVGEWLPMVRRLDARTLAFSSQDYIEGFRILRTLIALAGTR